MTTKGVTRAISAFNSSTHLWTSVPSIHPSKLLSTPALSSWKEHTATPSLSLLSWNIDAFSLRCVARSQRILEHIFDALEIPDIIFLQEVSREARDSILNDSIIRRDFLVTDAEDFASFEGVPFATMTFLSKKLFHSNLFSCDGNHGAQSDNEIEKCEEGNANFALGSVSRIKLPSIYKRDALCVDIIPLNSPNSVLRLINVHLDSLNNGFSSRVEQLQILADTLREPESGRGLIAGDFNAISPEDHELIDKNGLKDAWLAWGGDAGPGGATWSVGIERQDGLKPGRLDKAAMMGLEVREMKILRPGLIDIPVPVGQSYRIPWSDHCGLKCTFTF